MVAGANHRRGEHAAARSWEAKRRTPTADDGGQALRRAVRSFVLLAALNLTACGPAVAITEPATPTVQPTAAAPTPTALPSTIPLPSTATVAPTDSPAPATATPIPLATVLPEIELLFTGDINPGRCVYTKAKAAEDMA